jgi:hypothetical protein
MHGNVWIVPLNIVHAISVYSCVLKSQLGLDYVTLGYIQLNHQSK